MSPKGRILVLLLVGACGAATTTGAGPPPQPPKPAAHNPPILLPEEPKRAPGPENAPLVVLKMCISKEGAVTSVEVLEPPDPEIARRVLPEVRQWRYRPYMRGGKAVPACTKVTFNLLPEDPPPP